MCSKRSLRYSDVQNVCNMAVKCVVLFLNITVWRFFKKVNSCCGTNQVCKRLISIVTRDRSFPKEQQVTFHQDNKIQRFQSIESTAGIFISKYVSIKEF